MAQLAVFGRSQSDPHDYEPAILDWLGGRLSDYRAMARNLMHDHRISVQRESHFDTFVQRPCSPRTMQRALKDYFEENVRRRHAPDFEDDLLNGQNVLIRPGASGPIISPDVELVRMLDLTGVIHIIRWAIEQNLPGFDHRSKAIADRELCDELGDKLSSDDPSVADDCVEDVLAAMNAYRVGNPYQPTWASAWAAVEPYVPEGPERWADVLGVRMLPRPDADSRRWVILLRYSVSEAGTVVRPTQLDAGWEACHFPSPPQAAPAMGGHPVDLQGPPESEPLLPEFIHRQIDHTMDHWRRAGRAGGRLTPWTRPDLCRPRAKHLTRLRKHYGGAIEDWMPDAC